MKSHRYSRVGAALILTGLGLWLDGFLWAPLLMAAQEQGGKKEAAPEKAPEFKDAKTKQDFEDGQKLFEGKKYKEASAKFLSAAKGVNAAGRKAVNKWLAASQGGQRLEITRAQAARSLPQKTFFDLDDNLPAVIGTPIEKDYRQYLGEFEGKVLTVLEDFETPSISYSKKYGKTHQSDPALVYHGQGCIDWAQTEDLKGVQLRVAKVPKNWTPYSGIAWWLYVEKPIDMDIIIKCPGKTTEGPISLTTRFSPRSAGKWERIYLEFEKFRKVGKASLSDVEEFIMQTPKKDFKLRIDCIALVRKDSGGGAADQGKDAGKDTGKGKDSSKPGGRKK